MVTQSTRRISCLMLAALFLPALAGVVHAGVVVVNMAPGHGPVGTAVVLTAIGVDTTVPHGVTINGVAVPVTGVTTNEIRFTVSAGTTSGDVVVTEGGNAYPGLFGFAVTRPVAGTLTLPAGISRQGYRVASMGDFTGADFQTGQFATAVALDRRTIVWAFRGEHDPVFMSVVTPSMNQVAIDANSTGVAWAFLSPLVGTLDETRGQAVLSKLLSLPQTTSLASTIVLLSANGGDYSDDDRFASALIALLDAYLAQPVTLRSGQWENFEPGSPRGTAFRYLNLTNSIVPARKLKGQILDVDSSHPDYRLKLESESGGNRLDWYVEVYPLDPKQFSAGRDNVDRLFSSDTPRKLSLEPIESGLVKADLFSKKLDLVSRFASWISDLLFTPVKEELKFSEFTLPADVPGVYVSQAYSGNLWFGTTVFLPGNLSQSDLLDRLNGNTQWTLALAGNILAAAVDMVSLSFPADSFVDNPELKAKIIHTISADLIKALSTRNKDLFTADTLLEIVKTTATAIIKASIKEGFSKPENLVDKKGYAFGVIKVVGKVFDILGKYSKFSQSVERFSGFATPYSLALERSVVIVGNPFEPVILSFHPQQGRGGDLIRLEGYNFPATAGQMRVSFCTFASTADPDTPTAKLPVQVLQTTPTSLAFAVPTNFASVFPNLKAFICIEPTNSTTPTTTIPLPEPYREFFYIPPPQLMSVAPDPVAPGGALTLTGTNFFSGAAENHRVIFDGGTQVYADMAGETNLVATVPFGFTEGPHTVAVQLGGDTTAAIPFTVRKPASDSSGYVSGLGITVDKLDQSNAPDGHISLREAVLIANGTLGRPIEQHAPCESLPPSDPSHCPPQPRETDLVSGDDANGNGGGPLSRDTITIIGSLNSSTNVFAGALPAPTSGDTYSMGITIDGGGAGQDGWLLDGVEGVTLNNATLRNFGGHGIHFRNGANGNSVSNVRVENAGGSGVFFDGDAQNNQIFAMRVSGAGQHGLHLSGAQVRNNLCTLAATTTTNILGLYEKCGGNGVRLDNGAQFNQVQPGTVRSNALAGILITGAGTAYNLIGRQEGSLPRYYDIYFNGGPGIHLDDVRNNVVRYANPAGNQGDGVLLDGVNCTSNQVDGVYTGLDYFSGGFQPLALPNQGSGIHLRGGAHHNLIGSRIPGSFGGRGFIAGDRDDGILLEGPNTAYNTISRKHFGETFQGMYFSNGGSGIHLRGGAHHNILGDTHQFLDLHVMASPNAGILIEGAGTDFNQVIGNQIATSHGGMVPQPGVDRIGIHLKDSAKGNVIGVPGEAFSVFGPTGQDEFRFGNSIVNCTEAGVVLENCGGTIGPNGELVDPNVVQNNKIGEGDFGDYAPSAIGVKVINQALGNVIGGPKPGQGNRIVFNRSAGILLSNLVVTGAAQPNRIQNNVIYQNGNASVLIIGGGQGNPARSEDPLDPAITGVGVAVVNSTGNFVGDQAVTGNQIVGNLIGVYVADSEQTSVFGNAITNNKLAGVVIRGGRTNEIGGAERRSANSIYGNGNNKANQGAIIVGQSRNNRIQSNLIGVPNGTNHGVGILLKDASANQIGGDARPTGNVIAASQSHGIQISSGLSVGNRIQNNFIGEDRTGVAVANEGDGVRLDTGATGNVVGGEIVVVRGGAQLTVQAPNVIAHNLGAGVRVDGGLTVGNSILYNSITGNGGKGILLAAGGNFNIPPPIMSGFAAGVLNGLVPDLVAVPPGSSVQVFADADPLDPEGNQFLGEGTVQPDGTWTANLIVAPLFPIITMTATHGGQSSTSEFGTASTNLFDAGLILLRTDNRASDLAPAGASRLTVLKITAAAINADVRVIGLTFDATGSLLETAHVTAVELFRDIDGNGTVTDADTLLAGPTNYLADNGSIVFTNLDISVPEDTSQRWLLTYSLAPGAPAGATFRVGVMTAQSVDARFIHVVGGPLLAGGVYPLQSAEFTVNSQTRQTFGAWKQTKFSAGQLADPTISGDTADPDGDGVSNVLEYGFNLNPLVADRDAALSLGGGVPVPGKVVVFVPAVQRDEDFFTVTYVRRKQPSDLAYWVEASADLVGWISEGQSPESFASVGQTDIGGGLVLETVTIRSTTPMTGPDADPMQFFRVRVQLLP